MVKKKNTSKDLLTAGVGLSIGSTAIGRLPASSAQVGVQAGLGTAGKFFSPAVNIHMGGGIVSQLKKLKGGN